MLHKPECSTLVLVDIQNKLLPHIFEGQRVLTQIMRLANIARLLDVPVLGTEQNPQGLGQSVAQVRQICDSSNGTLEKVHFDACRDGLVQAIDRQRTQLIVTGCEAHVCVFQTCVGLLEQGFDVTLVTDAIGSRDPANVELAMRRSVSLGVTLASVEMLAFEWLRSSDHPQFRNVLGLIR